MIEIDTTKRRVECLPVTVDGTRYDLPLPKYMTKRDVDRIREARMADRVTAQRRVDVIESVYLEFFSRYIPDDVLGSLTQDEVEAIFRAWSGGGDSDNERVTLGES